MEKTMKLISVICLIVGAVLLRYGLSNGLTLFPNKESRKKKITKGDLWNTVMFFPDYFPETEDSTTHQLMWYLEEAKTSIDICMYCINFKMLENALIRQAHKGVKIRALTNSFSRGCRIMRRGGIQIRTKHHTWFHPNTPDTAVDLLHHKFVIIDDRAIMGGSLNWTQSGITENFENFMVTTAPITGEKFKTEFERLWAESSYRPPSQVQHALVNPFDQ